MLHVSEFRVLGELKARLGNAGEADAALLNDVIGATSRRYCFIGQTERATRLMRLIQSAAWIDAALALIDLELPMWQVRRLAYDGGEWHCALSRERALPDWLDQAIEARHADLSLAILGAFVEAQRVSARRRWTSVPEIRTCARDFYEAVSIDNYV